MKPNVKPETDDAAIDRILAAEEELIPSSMPKPIPFPWLRALPGIVLAVAVLGWCGFELASSGLGSAGEIPFAQPNWAAVSAHALEPAEWVAVALGFSMLSWILSRRIAGKSGLL
jgi:hypothetical protein